MRNNKKISELKFNILADAISAIDIVNVVVKNPNDVNIQLYLETKNLNSIDLKKMEEICTKYSSDDILVTYQIPLEKMIGTETVINKDTVCIFIEGPTQFDPELSFAFE